MPNCNFIHLSCTCWGSHLIIREAGTVIVSLVSSSITSFRRITTWKNCFYLFLSKFSSYLCLLVVKLRLLSNRSPQLKKMKLIDQSVSNCKWSHLNIIVNARGGNQRLSWMGLHTVHHMPYQMENIDCLFF